MKSKVDSDWYQRGVRERQWQFGGAQEELLVMMHDVSYDGGVFGPTEMGREAFQRGLCTQRPEKSQRSLDSINSNNKSQGVLCDTRGVYSVVLSTTSLSK